MTTTVAVAPDRTLNTNRWMAFALLLTGSILAPIDFFIVNVAMPSITKGLGASPSDVQLVISGYAIVYAVLLVTGGRLGDIFGRKTVFLWGLAGFAVASAFCGLAWSPASLIIARLLQALFAAAMAPQALASVHAMFPARERARALSIYGIALGLSSVFGQVLGGALVGADIDGFGWRLIFLINLPIAGFVLIAGSVVLRETIGQFRPRLDLIGVVLSSLALTALVLPLVEGREQGWPWWSVALLLTAPIFTELFRRYEIRLARLGGDPLVAIDAFEASGLLRGLGAILTLYAIATFFLTYSIYLQSALGFSALHAGLAILPFSAGFLTSSTASPIIARRLGTAAPSIGFLVSATGAAATAAVTGLSPTGVLPPWPLMVPALMMIGLGMGLAMPTMMRAIVERVGPQRAGLVGGLVNSTLQVSAAVSIAVIGGLFFTVLGTRTDPVAVTAAFSAALLAISACHAGGAVLAAGLGQRKTVSAPGR